MSGGPISTCEFKVESYPSSVESCPSRTVPDFELWPPEGSFVQLGPQESEKPPNSRESLARRYGGSHNLLLTLNTRANKVPETFQTSALQHGTKMINRLKQKA